ncbi:MAG TPA: hypothetical protein VM328_00020 [Fimbriimonadaceae bacterium]|nr:hypothetical protein [Fimbriimonadaceae bacterium]
MQLKALFAAAAVLAAGFVEAQVKAEAVEVPKNGPMFAKFDPQKMVTFSGRVIGIEVSAPANHPVPNVSLLVKLSNGGTALVELGPKPYLDHQRMAVRLKDTVKITGSKVFEKGGDSAILATEVNHNGFRVALRNADGKPFWIDQRR